VTLKADSVSFAGEASNGEASNIRLSTHHKEEGAGAAGNLLIKAGNISFADGAYIRSETYGRGKGGEVTLKADSASFIYGANIKSATYGRGNGGTIIIEAAGTVTLSGLDSKGQARQRSYGCHCRGYDRHIRDHRMAEGREGRPLP